LKQIGFDRWAEYVGMEKEQERQEAMTVAQQRMAQQLQDSESECKVTADDVVIVKSVLGAEFRVQNMLW
jgi:hypothetical protein